MYSPQKRIAAGVAAAACVAVAGCSSPAPAADDNVITIFTQQSATQDLDKNAYTLMLEEKFGVDLQFQATTQDAGAAAEARQISLASGEYPDAYLLIPWVDQFSQSELLKLGSQGVLVPLNDLIAENAPDIAAAFETTPDFKKLATAPDGKIWGLPQWNDCYHCSYPSKFWINSQWLKNLKLDPPTTPDELFDVLMAFKTKDPNSNGVADEIPLSGDTRDSILPFIMNAFSPNSWSQNGANQPVSLALVDGKVQLQASQTGWRQGLEFLSKLWQNGLVDESAFSQNPDALLAKGSAEGEPVVGAVGALHPAIFVGIGMDDKRDASTTHCRR